MPSRVRREKGGLGINQGIYPDGPSFGSMCTRTNTFDSQSHEHVKSFEMLLCNCAPLIARVSIAVTLASHRLHPNPRADQGLLRASIFLHLRVPAPRGRGRLGAARARAHIQFLDSRLSQTLSCTPLFARSSTSEACWQVAHPPTRGLFLGRHFLTERRRRYRGQHE
jgi:hypothetical protein